MIATYRRAARRAARGQSGRAARHDPAKPTHFAANDLKPGLFVEVDFRHVTAQNPVSSLTVIRPIEDIDARPADRTKK